MRAEFRAVSDPDLSLDAMDPLGRQGGRDAAHGNLGAVTDIGYRDVTCSFCAGAMAAIVTGAPKR
jgi:hypothetical protein